MRIVVQRVSSAAVGVEGRRVGAVGHGLLLLVGIAPEDVDLDFSRVAAKIVELRIFQDDEGRMNRSLRDVGGDILAISQFTLFGDARKGRRPSFVGAAAPEVASPLFDRFVDALRAKDVGVSTGRFGAKMDVSLVNDGPVTLVLEVAPPASWR